MKISYRSITTADFKPENQEEAEMQYRAKAQEEMLSRRYILTDKVTPGLGYDDRLEVRLGFKRTIIFKLKKEGKLDVIPVKKMMMTERAIRRFEDGLMPMTVVGTSDLKAA